MIKTEIKNQKMKSNDFMIFLSIRYLRSSSLLTEITALILYSLESLREYGYNIKYISNDLHREKDNIITNSLYLNDYLFMFRYIQSYFKYFNFCFGVYYTIVYYTK